MATITYTDKVALNENASIADINKITDNDMNSIKSVVNDTIISGLGLQTDNWISGGSYNIGALVIDNNNIYENTTGTNTTTAPSQDSTNWAIVPIIADGKINYKLLEPTLLYESTTGGTIGSLVLEDSIVNYRYIEIYMINKNNSFIMPAQRFYTNNQAEVSLQLNLSSNGSGAATLAGLRYLINGTAMTNSYYYQVNVIGGSTPSGGSGTNSNMAVVKVLGYK